MAEDAPAARSHGIDVDDILFNPATRDTARNLFNTLLSQHFEGSTSLPASAQQHADSACDTVTGTATANAPPNPRPNAVQSLIDSLNLKTHERAALSSPQGPRTRPPGRPRKAMATTDPAEVKADNAVAADSHISGETDGDDLTVAPQPQKKSKKRKAAPSEQSTTKRGRPRKMLKESAPPANGASNVPARHRIPLDIWQRVLEFCPPTFLYTKARVINKAFKEIVDTRLAIAVRCRQENYGFDTPPCPEGLTEIQYNNLFGGKGCMDPNCNDKNASKTYWSWNIRWCMKCYHAHTEREHEIKQRLCSKFDNNVVQELLESIPWALRDSWGRAYPLVEDHSDSKATISKIFKRSDVNKLVADYKALDPGPFAEDPTASDQESTDARARHAQLVDDLPARRTELLKERKEANKIFMETAFKIEANILRKAKESKKAHDANREGRRVLYLACAKTELPEIPEDFIIKTKAYKAACRIYRTPGTERSWRELKRKIEDEWASAQQLDGTADFDLSDGRDTTHNDEDNSTRFASSVSPSLNPSLSTYSRMLPGIPGHTVSGEHTALHSRLPSANASVANAQAANAPASTMIAHSAMYTGNDFFRRTGWDGSTVIAGMTAIRQGNTRGNPMLPVPINATGPLPFSVASHNLPPTCPMARFQGNAMANANPNMNNLSRNNSGIPLSNNSIGEDHTLSMADIMNPSRPDLVAINSPKRRYYHSFLENDADAKPAKRHSGPNVFDQGRDYVPIFRRAKPSFQLQPQYTSSMDTLDMAESRMVSPAVASQSMVGSCTVPFFSSTGGRSQGSAAIDTVAFHRRLLKYQRAPPRFESQAQIQALARCLDCGQPGCSSGCATLRNA